MATPPILSFDTEPERVSGTEVTYDGPSLGGSVTVDFPEDEPTGVPLVYRIDVVEHTLDGQRRTLGHTPVFTRNPTTGEVRYRSVTNFRNALRHYDVTTTHEDGEKTTRIHTDSTTSRWETPQMSEAVNRSKEFSTDYTDSMFERPWAFQYTITDEEADQWREWNEFNYHASPSGPHEWVNISRLFRQALENPILARVAKNIHEATEASGLTSDLAKLRAVTDYIQRMEYTPDGDIPYGEPRVKHPVTTLYDGTGDCEDKVILAAGLLYQDALPDFTLGCFSIEAPSHAGLAISRDSIDYDGELDSVGNSDEYIYVEVTYPGPLGMRTENWAWPEITRIHPPDQPNPLEK